ncbi:MAG: peptidase, partial [Rhodospirillales bacterium]|nr:peptidase [Rhodospirillales bacterium]
RLAPTLFRVARIVGEAIREVHRLDAEPLRQQGADFSASFILGGQIKGERPRLFNIYSAGNFIEATPETCFFQIGEIKYGKPVFDRILSPKTALDEAAKLTLISFDSTMRSNLSVGPPIDLLCYRTDSFQVDVCHRFGEGDPYMADIRRQWGEGLRRVFEGLPPPMV